MRKWSSVSKVLLSLVLGTSLKAGASPIASAHRPLDVTYEQMVKKAKLAHFLSLAKKPNGLTASTPPVVATPVNSAVSLGDLDDSTMLAWDTWQDVVDAFSKGRDDRTVSWTYKGKSFPRRPSWLYPDDGCFARAALFKNYIQKTLNMKQTVYKLFAFGNLVVKTDNHPNKYVSWWYHVVPLIKYDDQLYAFDPAIDSEKPLTIDEWATAVNFDQDKGIKFSICAGNTYTPFDSCLAPSYDPGKTSLNDQKNYLPDEWSRVLLLKRDPVEELGDHPPWTVTVRDLLTIN